MPQEFQNTVNALIRHRRSVYPSAYSGEPVKDEVIEAMLENANWAPTHKLTEPWRFVVFKGDGIKKLASYSADIYRSISTAEGNFQEEKYEKLKQKPLLCSHIISIGMHRDPKERIPEVEEISAVACAVQNMLLTAAAHNVGAYWSTGGITFYPEAKPFFGLGEKDRLLGFLMLGMPKGDKWPQGKRNPAVEKVKWVMSS